jgi:hypothetical protein
VHSDFDSLDSGPGAGAKNVKGTLGGGSGKLSAASMSGDVTILRGSQRAAADGAGTAPPGQGAAPPGESAAMGSGGPAKEGEPR